MRKSRPGNASNWMLHTLTVCAFYSTNSIYVLIPFLYYHCYTQSQLTTLITLYIFMFFTEVTFDHLCARSHVCGIATVVCCYDKQSGVWSYFLDESSTVCSEDCTV